MKKTEFIGRSFSALQVLALRNLRSGMAKALACLTANSNQQWVLLTKKKFACAGVDLNFSQKMHSGGVFW
ncbi:hypothetical protein IFO69_11885 [Echinicola sp. CAU 1574]|uniref:Uncharacterized protein n=1 Tax=Echinicola arenosa TaxID=2774144 RepID=A0ABR9AL68_9BACT|nr:hypothetical protein [Echinicola arenosa]MBD8489445.1 hypothetical protein [Echinicola arenosa]